MAKFMIAYDLKQRGQNYDCIHEKLNKLKAFHSQGSVWLLKSETTCKALRDNLKDCLDANDELMVVQISDWASCNMKQDAEYLNK